MTAEQQLAQQMRREVKEQCAECGKPQAPYLLQQYAFAVKRGSPTAAEWLLCTDCYQLRDL